MDTPTLARVGQLLFGVEWQRAMARALGPHHPAGPLESVNDRIVRRWASGERAIPDWIVQPLAEMLARRAGQLEGLALECRELQRELDPEAAPPTP